MVFPIGDDNSDRTIFPYVTVALIAINALVFVIPQGMGTNDAFTMAFSTVPAEIVSGKDLVTEDRVVQLELPDGSVRPVEVPGLEPTPISVYITLLTSMFMHGGWAHILGNMWFLWIFGDNIEEDLGRGRYIAFYLLCGLLASLAHVFVSAWGDSAQIPSLGASGAISGVMGAYLVLHPKRRVTVLLLRMMTQVPGYVAVGIWFVFQIVASLPMLGGMSGGGVAYAAHIGGFIAGAALAKPFVIGRPAKQTYVDRGDYHSPRRRDQW
ncbi:MAG TPA: rhomboid family intramembrane serine protease [Pirellulaceae bacterium]|nr:rhomboid family intramembrane serine protease [Pirellulaceae bacterium]